MVKAISPEDEGAPEPYPGVQRLKEEALQECDVRRKKHARALGLPENASWPLISSTRVGIIKGLLK
jgi:hypothetical protein